MTWNEFLQGALLAVLGGGFGAAVIKLLGDGIAWKRQRKAVKEDHAQERQEKAEDQAAKKTEERLADMEVMMEAQGTALKFLLYDRIRHLGQTYIADGSIDFDDRRIINEMHSSYHNGLKGNGDLDVLMREVNDLPLKVHKMQ